MTKESVVISNDMNSVVLRNVEDFKDGRYVAVSPEGSKHHKCRRCAFYTTDMDNFGKPTQSKSCDGPGNTSKFCWSKNRSDHREIVWQYADLNTSTTSTATAPTSTATAPTSTAEEPTELPVSATHEQLKRHVYYDLITEYYGNYTQHRGNLWGWNTEHTDNVWGWVRVDNPRWLTTFFYRISVDMPSEPPEELQMITYPGGTVRFYKPELEPLAKGDTYWLVDIASRDVHETSWSNDTYDHQRLEAGLVHKQHHRALQHLNAMTAFAVSMVSEWKNNKAPVNPK